MKLSRILSAAAVAGLLATGAHALPSIPDIDGIANADANGEGDLVLAVWNSSVSSELAVDVGPASDYYSTTNVLASGNGAVSGGLTPGQAYTVAAYNSNDITDVFGSKAYVAGTTWTVAGGTGSGNGVAGEPSDTLYLSNLQGNAALHAQATLPNQGSISSGLDAETSGLSGDSQANANGSRDATTITYGTSTAFDAQAGSNGTFGYGEGNLTTSTVSAGSGSSVLELYELLPTDNNSVGGPNTVNLGYFTLSNSGLTFTAFEAIPEPSMYAAILGALTIGFVIVRRRFQSGVLNALV